MNDPLSRLRADLDAGFPDGGDWPESDKAAASDDLDEFLLTFYRSQPASETYLAVLDALAEAEAAADAHPGRAAASAQSLRGKRGARSSSVEQALRCPAYLARAALAAALRITSDAADLLLNRPAAVLLTYSPDAVAAAGDACGRGRGELFRAIADSSRVTGDFVYPYRPGVAAVEPARRAVDQSDALGELVAWGRAFLESPQPPR